MKIVLFNAPPGAGKDTAVRGLQSLLDHKQSHHPECGYVVGHHKMSEPLKLGAHALFGLDAPADFFEQSKDTALPEFMGKTPRQVYIGLSEKFVKPFFGKQAFGWSFVNRLREKERLASIACNLEYLCLCSDLGFDEELVPLVAAFGAENIYIIHISREGHDFSNDSRSYIQHPHIKSTWVINDDTEATLAARVYDRVTAWLSHTGTYAKETTTA